MTQVIDFGPDSPRRLGAAGYAINLRSSRQFTAEFVLERPCVIQGSIHTDLPISVGAFTLNVGGRIRAARIGRYCSISDAVQLGWDDHPTDWVTSSMSAYVADVHGWGSSTGHKDRKIGTRFSSMRGITNIGNDVWIGYGAFIRAGVTVGDGAVIAAQSVVLSDVPPYAIVGGSPAKLIRWRFPAEVIAMLSATRWWDYNIFELDQNLLARPTEFVPYFEAMKERGAISAFAGDRATPADLARIAGVAVKEV